MDNYAMYLRKSRADIDAESRGELETLARHEKILLELAQKMNIQVAKIFKEIVSGETIAARPEMQKLLVEVEQGSWTGVLVMEVERLARGDGIDQQIVLNAFKQGNARIITPIKTYDPNDEFDEEYFEFGLFMSRREYKTINRRIQRGRIASVKEGKTINPTPPYGYNRIKIPNEKGYTLEPNEDANVVKLIFDLYLNGNGMNTIAKELDKLNIKPRNLDKWAKSTISDILSNPVYIGKIRWGYRKNKKINVDGEQKKVKIINEDYYLIDGLHPAIVEEDTFYKVQALRDKKAFKSKKRDLKLKNPLSGLIYCSKCNSLMNRLGTSSSVPYDLIKCPNNYCDNVSAPLFLVEQKIILELSKWLSGYEVEINLNARDFNENYIGLRQNSIKSIEHEIRQIAKQLTQTYDLIERQVYTVEEFILRKNDLCEKKQYYEELLTNLKDEINKINNLNEVKSVFIPQRKKLLYEYDQIKSVQTRNEILRTLVHKIEYLKTTKNRRGQISNDNFELVIMPRLPAL